MHKPSLTPSARLRLIRAIGCLAYPVGLGVVIGLALFIKPMLGRDPFVRPRPIRDKDGAWITPPGSPWPSSSA